MPRSLPGPVMALPWTNASPVVGCSKPAIMRSSVDFPQPEAPIRQTNSPCGIVRSTGASASTSSSSTAKRLVTPRMVRMMGDGSSLKVLRTPAQEAITDRDDDPVGDKSAGADHDHAGDHEIGARKCPAVHDDRAEAGGNARHFTDHDEDPGESMRNPQSVDDGRQRRGKDDFAKHCRAGTA